MPEQPTQAIVGAPDLLTLTLPSDPIKIVPGASYAEIEAAKEAARPKTDDEVLHGEKWGAILWGMYGLESTWGSHDSCKQQGKYNGFGWGSNRICFDTFQQAADTVNTWLDNHISTMDIPGSLCYYNSGRPVNDCSYYQNFLILMSN